MAVVFYLVVQLTNKSLKKVIMNILDDVCKDVLPDSQHMYELHNNGCQLTILGNVKIGM
jgi:hypothetical protein